MHQGGEPMIKLLLDNDQSLSLGMFGDAVRKVTELLLVLLNNTSKVIFIDEIENGIHFTKHKELWTKLFEVVGDDMQIFATSHSAEMIKAFNEAAYTPSFENKGMYFEMGRTKKTQQIVVNPMNMEMLSYKIRTNSPFRAE
jgi:AAA15 family ATPase/GTPase